MQHLEQQWPDMPDIRQALTSYTGIHSTKVSYDGFYACPDVFGASKLRQSARGWLLSGEQKDTVLARLR